MHKYSIHLCFDHHAWRCKPEVLKTACFGIRKIVVGICFGKVGIFVSHMKEN